MRLAHHWAPALSQHFLIVHWDQRGAGRSYAPTLDPEALSIQQLVEDAIELTTKLKARFSNRRVLLVGQSWGTMLGAHIAAVRPQLFCGYVGIGQMVDARENLRMSHRFALARARRSGAKDALKRLAAMTPPQEKDIPEVMRRVMEFGGSLKGKDDQRTLNTIRSRATIRATRFEETFEDQGFSMRALAPEIMVANLKTRIPKLNLPVFLIAGRHDFVTPGKLARQYFDLLESPKKQFYWFEESAHYPHLEQTKRFAQVLTRDALPVCR